MRLDRGDFVRRHRHRTVSADNADFSRRILDKIPRPVQNPVLFVQQHHVDIDVTRMKLSIRDCLLAAANIDHFLDRNEHLFDVIAHLLGFEALLDAFFHLVLLTGQSMDDKPLASLGMRQFLR